MAPLADSHAGSLSSAPTLENLSCSTTSSTALLSRELAVCLINYCRPRRTWFSRRWVAFAPRNPTRMHPTTPEQSLTIPENAHPIFLLITCRCRPYTPPHPSPCPQARGPPNDITTIYLRPDAFKITPTFVLYHRKWKPSKCRLHHTEMTLRSNTKEP